MKVENLTWLAETELGEENPQPVDVANRAMARYAFESPGFLEPGGFLRRRENRVTSRYV